MNEKNDAEFGNAVEEYKIIQREQQRESNAKTRQAIIDIAGYAAAGLLLGMAAIALARCKG